MTKLILIDGNAIIHRAYHAMPNLTTPKGQPIGATQGFINMLLRIIQDLKPTHLAVAWDRKEPTFRQKMYKEYQSQRPEVDRELISQFEKVRKALDAFDIATYDKVGYEADDIIGTLSAKAADDKDIDEVVIVTGDKDQLQLVNRKVKVYMPVKGLSVGILLGEKEVKEKMGVSPKQVIDLKAFMGDPSDNYPGIYGVGPKTAQDLLEKYGTYHNVFRHIDDVKDTVRKKLENGKDEGDMSYELATIVTDIDDINLDKKNLSKWSVGNSKTLKLFEEYGFKSLTKRVKDLADEINQEKQQNLFG